MPLIGALDPSVWAGLVFSNGPGRGFGLRFVVERRGERADRDDLYFLVKEVGPHAPDGSYARIRFDTDRPFGKGGEPPIVSAGSRETGLTLEWSRQGSSSAVGRVAVGYEGYLELRGYFPWDWKGTWKKDGLHLIATASEGSSALGVVLTRLHGGLDPHDDVGEEVVARLAVHPGDHFDFYAALRLGTAEAASAAERMVQEIEIGACLEHASRRYEANRARVEGEWQGLASAITNNLHWTMALQPERGRLYTPAGRRWIYPARKGQQEHWTVFCWDSFFNALELALEAPELARSTVQTVVETQYPNGNVPNWRGRFAGTPDRSQPPLGSFVVVKLYLRTGDRSFLEDTFPYLERWSEWWCSDKRGRPRRAGHNPGLFTWGCDLDEVIDSPVARESEATGRQRAAWESGQDDLPNWDDAGWNDGAEVFELDAVDLNSYLALDLECLSFMASELGDEEKARRYRDRHEVLARRMNEALWADDVGLYMDRLEDGRFSGRVAASNFLPLLAGVAPPSRAERMLAVLEDERRFWGEYVLPTISREDPAFRDQQYWRGSIWPPVNYLIYAGLRRYRFDETAGELAARSVTLILRAWRELQSSYESYDCRTGRGAGHPHQSWGPLLALMGIEEFIDVTLWDGLRIGTLAPPRETTLKRIRILGREWEVLLSPNQLHVEVDGSSLLDSTSPIVLRNVKLDRRQFEADVNCRETVRLSLFGEARLNMELVGERFRSVSNTLVLPSGDHRLRASRLG